MNSSTTNIFCIIANIGSDQEVYLNHILNDRSFTKHTRIARLVYNTTRPRDNREEQENETKYNYFTIEEYEDIDKDEIIDFRSYYTLPYDTVYYFTLKDNISNKENLICIASPYQYENYRRWVYMENIKNPNSYNLFAILIHCSLKNRILNKINNLKDSESDIDILEFCRRILEDNAEFDNAKSRLPELNDPMNCNNTCYILNDINKENDFKQNIEIIKGFILDKVSNQLIY